MFKKMLLVFLCFTLFLSIPGCKKKLPTQPDIPTKILPTIEYFTATPESISLGESSTLSWSVSNATTITIDQGIGTVSAKGTTEVSPEDTKIYTLTAKNSDGQKTKSCKLEVMLNPVTIDYFISNPPLIWLGETSMLSWSTTNATDISINQGIGEVSAIGEIQVGPKETTTYTLTAKNSINSLQWSCKVEVIKWACLDATLIPGNPIFIYDPDSNICTGEFNLVLSEGAGVGGSISGLLVEAWTETLLHSEIFPGGSFLGFGSLNIYCPLVITGKPNGIVIWAEGLDENGYMIELIINSYISWKENIGTMALVGVTK